ncbi:2-dehydropantoate 2-reductase (plasmid) [Tundrisphaera sp. TA3]|uniref:2-dehydropantoate 2-reductase n=1 Tax=Tundrisphaera sp. TA3 TaxID=3435775 RepID=UPI003EBF25CB
MRILVVGAGATGGYFGGRLLEAGRDVTFLVRPRRAEILARSGLSIRSSQGDVDLPAPPTILASGLRPGFDAVLLSCKAYDLEGAIDSFAPAVGPETLVVPLLNGMRHLDVLDQRFGAERVLGGTCFISSQLGDDGRVVHRSDVHELTFGAREAAQRPKAEALSAAMQGARFTARMSEDILQDMWEKWAFLATFAGITCLMRASIGDVMAAGGVGLIGSLLEECRTIAAASGRPPREEYLAWVRGVLTKEGSPLTASMLLDVERGAPTEADHILGDLLRRAEPSEDPAGLLRIAYTALKAYEVRRLRE